MWKLRLFGCVILVLLASQVMFGADIVLNEYNAVNAEEFLNGGDSQADEDGGRASDSYFGRIQGNGGDWFELIVIKDHLDVRNWKLDIYEGGILDETLNISDHVIWSDLRSGTIITVSEDVPSDISYNPAAGDWWINVQAHDDADGEYIEASNFVVNANSWQLGIRNSDGGIVFGPAGEGISPASGVGDTEVFRLEADPSNSTERDSKDYDDGDDFSTFGAANQWGRQDIGDLRIVVIEPSSISLLHPNGSEVLKAGTTQSILWQSEGLVESVLVEYSLDNGQTWIDVDQPNVGNTGSYDWLVPLVTAEQCLVRISNLADLNVYHISDQPFSIYQCTVLGDVTGDCIVDMADFALMASYWLECGNPYDPPCIN
jgi:hypothetical protein